MEQYKTNDENNKKFTSWNVLSIQIFSVFMLVMLVLPHMLDSDSNRELETTLKLFVLWFWLISIYGLFFATRKFIKEGTKTSIGTIVLTLISLLIFFILVLSVFGHF